MDCTSNPAAVITGINISAAPVVLSSSWASSTSIYSYMTMLAIISSDSSLQLNYFSEAIVSSTTIASSSIIMDNDHGTFEKSEKMFVTSGKYNYACMIIICLIVIVILFSLSGVFFILSPTIHFAAFTVCYFRRKRKRSQSNAYI